MTTTAVNPTTAQNLGRVHAIDLLRGLVIIVMALDHVRDYFSMTPFTPEDLSQTWPELFFTRWITHFCAPVFVFLSGTSAWLYRYNRGVSKHELARFLLTRGLWLVVVEITWVTFSWQFGYNFLILQVIWVIGLSMIILAALIYLPTLFILVIGLIAVGGHNVLDGITAASWGDHAWVWMFLHEQNYQPFQFGPLGGAFFGYPLIPWFGVMALGYVAGAWFEQPAEVRRRCFAWLGLIMIALFLVLRGTNLYGNPTPWAVDERGVLWSVISFFNTNKYPPSLSYLLMTLGPALLFIPLLERWRGRFASIVEVFGKAPFFFYVLHLPVIHLAGSAWQYLSLKALVNPMMPANTWPDAYEPNLFRAYLAWVVIVMVLYWPCRWFMNLRRRNKAWWLSYL